MQDCPINFKLRNEQKKESRERDSGYGYLVSTLEKKDHTKF